MSKSQDQKEREQGLSLLDIGPLSESVPVTDTKSINVFGVSVKGLFIIFQRFPEVGQWFKGGVGVQGKIDPAKLMLEAPDAIASIIAAGCGEAGNEQAEANAARLPVEAQLDILEAIARLTFRSGFGPFVQRIVALSKQVESLNYGRASATTSPPVSKNVSPQATNPNPSGG
jgi:hypothetical protein